MSDVETIYYRFSAAALTGIDVVVTEVRCVERMSEPYRVELTLRIHSLDADIDSMLAKDGLLEIGRDQHARRFCGVVRHIEEGTRSHQFQTIRVIMVPALWMLGLRRNTRIFQEEKAEKIIETVLEESLGMYGRKVDLDLKEKYPEREYCVQYQETDLAFVQRLMEEHGIHYSFDHSGDQELMVLRDRNKSFEKVETLENDPDKGAVQAIREFFNPGEVPFAPTNSHIVGYEPIARFRRRHLEGTTAVTLLDWDWTKGGDLLVKADEAGKGVDGRTRESYEHGEGRSLQLTEYKPRKYPKENSKRQALIRREAHTRDELVCEGVGYVVKMRPGVTFEIMNHPLSVGEYLITEVEHLGVTASATLDKGGSSDVYHNRFRCIPLAKEYRPIRRTPKPRISSIQTAVVTGPGGEEIHTDEHGRIKVQFHWDRDGKYDEKSSCWIRVQQPWAGNTWGFWWVPRIEMEVVVHFVNGDPDRPLVSGCLYNATNLPPYPMPDEKTKSTIKSNSSLGGNGSNEFRFEDLAGSEEIYTHAEKDYNEVVEHDMTTHVLHDQKNEVLKNQTQLVKVNQTETVHRDQTMTVDGDRKVTVQGDFGETVEGTETRLVTGDVSETFESNETRTVKADLTETIGGNETRTIRSNHSETISGNFDLAVTKDMTHKITAALTQTALQGITQNCLGAYNLTAAGALMVNALGGVKLLAGGGVSMVAPAGVIVINSNWDWIGGIKLESGAFSSSIKLAKIELCGMSYGATGVKFEHGLAKLETYANEFEVNTMALYTYASRIKNGALEVDTGAELDS